MKFQPSESPDMNKCDMHQYNNLAIENSAKNATFLWNVCINKIKKEINVWHLKVRNVD